MNFVVNHWSKTFVKIGALWVRGEEERNHIKVSCGGVEIHTTGYFNSEKIVGCTDIVTEAAKGLLLPREDGPSFRNFFPLNEKEVVLVGPFSKGVPLIVHELSEKIREMTGMSTKHIKCIYLEKDKNNGSFRSIGTIPNGSQVILCDDSLITGATISRMVAFIRFLGADVSCVLVLVNLSDRKMIDSVPIHSLVDLKCITWRSGNCPLCTSGHTAIADPKLLWDEYFQRS